MSSREQEIRSIRLQKRSRLEELGSSPYASEIKKHTALSEMVRNFSSLVRADKSAHRPKKHTIVGRIMSQRGAGKIAFAELYDGTDRFQVIFQQDFVGKEAMKQFTKLHDIGDFIQCTGTLGKSKTKEPSLFVTSFTMLSKSILPLPDAHYGLHDEETRFRKRYLDMLMNARVKDRFVLRTQVIKTIRSFLDQKGLLEIETPILQNQAGGAMAETFDTHHNDYDMPMVLRIALELPHKMLMISGLKGVYEIGKNFRNEGSDPTHIQEFTMLEWYAAYESLETNIKWTEAMVKACIKLTGKKSFSLTDPKGKKQMISFAGTWPRVTFAELLKKNAKLDVIKASDSEVFDCALTWGMDKADAKKLGRANLLDYIYKKSSRNKIMAPTFVTNYPGDLKPLARQNPDGTAAMCQLIVAGAEITNQYAELIDPVAQRTLLERQAKAKAKGDAEAMSVDEEFLTAMEYGMPPMTGFGMGIDRLMAILTEQDNLRETIFFPILKPSREK